MTTNRGLYIHIPFCKKKCGYCGFLSFQNQREEVIKRYVDCLVKELELVGRRHSGSGACVDTVFIGGGTPSILDIADIEAIMHAAKAYFTIAAKAEITIETNPGTVNEPKLKAYREMGINRLSIGVQSFDDILLKTAGRIHNAAEAVQAVELARKAGFDNINIDLMFSLPGQTDSKWANTIKKAVELSPEHISFYSLQIEENTPFYDAVKGGRFSLPSDEQDREMYEKAVFLLKNAGYCHYEISNAAKPGFECRHNMKYWSFDEYFGVGLGASSFISVDRDSDMIRKNNERDELGEIGNIRKEVSTDGIDGTWYADDNVMIRYKNKESLEDYFSIPEGNNICPIAESHINSVADNAFEFVFTALRKIEGVSYAEFQKKVGVPFEEIYGHLVPSIKKWQKNGLLLPDEKGFRLTFNGINVSNSIMAEFAEPMYHR